MILTPHVCPWWQIYALDNFLRPWFHNISQIYSPYVTPRMRVLDVGCDAGFTFLGLARLVGEQGKVFAVDLQSQMLAMVGRRAKRAQLEKRIILHQCHQHSLGLKTSVDFINGSLLK
jgi:ubiquinone/menaquinone biosynthesis C-methylase UbiE